MNFGSTFALAPFATDAWQEVPLDELSVAGSGRPAGGPTSEADDDLAKGSVSATRTDTPLREVPQTVVILPDQVRQDAAATGVGTAFDLAGIGRANNFAGPGLAEFTIRGFDTGKYHHNGFRSAGDTHPRPTSFLSRGSRC
jgi:iron complex outermembrane receptor protein